VVLPSEQISIETRIEQMAMARGTKASAEPNTNTSTTGIIGNSSQG